MKKIKAIILVLAMALAAVLCGSCGEQADELVQFINERVERVDEGVNSLIRDSHKREDHANELVQCLNEHDEEGIVNLLREKARTSSDIDLEQQISDVFNLFGDRTITSYNWESASEETHWEKGKKTRCRGGTIIDEVELSDGSDDIDMIVFYTVWVDEEDPELVGMNWIKIITDDEEEYRIGEPNVQ